MAETLYYIYKEYKHCEDFRRHGIEKVYRALKKHNLQVVMVDNFGVKKLYNYVPEIDKFEFLMEE